MKTDLFDKKRQQSADNEEPLAARIVRVTDCPHQRTPHCEDRSCHPTPLPLHFPNHTGNSALAVTPSPFSHPNPSSPALHPPQLPHTSFSLTSSPNSSLQHPFSNSTLPLHSHLQLPPVPPASQLSPALPPHPFIQAHTTPNFSSNPFPLTQSFHSPYWTSHLQSITSPIFHLSLPTTHLALQPTHSQLSTPPIFAILNPEPSPTTSPWIHPSTLPHLLPHPHPIPLISHSIAPLTNPTVPSPPAPTSHYPTPPLPTPNLSSTSRLLPHLHLASTSHTSFSSQQLLSPPSSKHPTSTIPKISLFFYLYQTQHPRTPFHLTTTSFNHSTPKLFHLPSPLTLLLPLPSLLSTRLPTPPLNPSPSHSIPPPTFSLHSNSFPSPAFIHSLFPGLLQSFELILTSYSIFPLYTPSQHCAL